MKYALMNMLPIFSKIFEDFLEINLKSPFCMNALSNGRQNRGSSSNFGSMVQLMRKSIVVMATEANSRGRNCQFPYIDMTFLSYIIHSITFCTMPVSKVSNGLDHSVPIILSSECRISFSQTISEDLSLYPGDRYLINI